MLKIPELESMKIGELRFLKTLSRAIIPEPAILKEAVWVYQFVREF